MNIGLYYQVQNSINVYKILNKIHFTKSQIQRVKTTLSFSLLIYQNQYKSCKSIADIVMLNNDSIKKKKELTNFLKSSLNDEIYTSS